MRLFVKEMDPKQALTIKLMAWALVTYLAYFLIGAVSVNSGLIDLPMSQYVMVVVFACSVQVLFFFIACTSLYARVGLSSFVFTQILFGLSLIFYFMCWVGDDVRSSLANMSVLGAVFGLHSLNKKQFILLTGFPIFVFGGIIARDYYLGGLQIELSVAVLEWVVLVLMVISFSCVAHYLTHFQLSLKAKRNELARSQECLLVANREILGKNNELELAQRELRSALKQMAEKAVRDELTGLYNRHQFSETLHAQVSVAKSVGCPLGLLMVDIDNFKSINDKYGHPAGDKILKSFSEIPESCLRKSDFIARMGGEEFVVLLPNTDGATLLLLAERIRAYVESMCFDEIESHLKITVSLGATLFRIREKADDMIERADSQLYRAKSLGRNQVAYNW
ncbi:MAG: hypothetical protein COB51_01140 [Moraxellaceae bacterium]|nr:MAG: hypothetical protein COB51_01140 [Moraxellaceae bacterium]